MNDRSSAGGDQLAIIVVNYGSSGLIEHNLAPLSDSTTVIVVDNFSTPEERERLTALASGRGWHAVLPEGNTGFGGGVNAGVTEAWNLGASVCIALNPDAVLSPATAVELARRTREAPTPTLVGPTILRPDGSVWSAGHDLYLHDGRMRATRRRAQFPDALVEPWLTGACMAFDRRVWDLTGGFADEYFLYWEDVDFCHRLTRAGGLLEPASDLTCVHDEGGTQSAGAGRGRSANYYYYNIRNRLLFASRNLPQARRAWARKTPLVAWEVLMQGGKKQFRRPAGPLLAFIRGMWDGFRGKAGPRI